MKTRWLALGIAGMLSGISLHGGTIKGVVRAHGKKEAETLPDGKYESRKFKFVERVNYAELTDFVVYIDQELAVKLPAPTQPVRVITQKDATFSPHVLPVVVGTTVEWPNRDDIFHNVFSYSEGNDFDLGLYKEEVKTVPFKKVGRVDVFCSIHSKMHCIILVLPNPFFAKTDARGTYVLANVPAGTYRLKAWHERMPSQSKEVTVPESGEVKVDFLLGIQGLPQY